MAKAKVRWNLAAAVIESLYEQLDREEKHQLFPYETGRN